MAMAIRLPNPVVARISTIPMPGSGRGRPAETPVTSLLSAWREGDATALDRLVPLVHAELRRLARRQMAGERPGHTLQTTALVNEAYMRLSDLQRVEWQDRGHFFAMAARLMRRILVDHARARRVQKRGDGVRPAAIDAARSVAIPARSIDLLALDEALTALAALDERKAQVVELRYFGGLTAGETAAALEVSEETVHRDWRLAKLWLLRTLGAGIER